MESFSEYGSTLHPEGQGGFPIKYRRIKEAVSTRDREWFERHPGESHYVRPYVPGELYPHPVPPLDNLAIWVSEFVPGGRWRRPIALVRQTSSRRITLFDDRLRIVVNDIPIEGFSS